MRNVVRRLALFFFLGISCRADLTLRYTVDVKASGAPTALPKAMEFRIKGDKTLTKLGTLTTIIDNNSAVTLFNPATKQYAQVSMAEYAGLRAGLPAAAAALKDLNFEVETRTTGQFEMISGIRAEEHLTTMNVSTNAPGMPARPVIRLELHTWMAGPDDLHGVPALRQYATSVQRAMRMSAAGDAMERLLQQLPGASEKLRAVTEAAAGSAESLTLKVREAVYNLKGDPNAPIVAITIELAEISSDAIADSVFDVPPDFQLSSLAELRNSRGIPVVIYKRDPDYTEEARRAKLNGSVMLKIVVGADGLAKDIQVVKSLGLGMDEKAMEAVSEWRFRPAERNGQPVDFPATIEVTFRIVDRPPQQ
jgi:TonB family protein